MATTINAYSVSLGLDASGFIDGAKVSRSEMNQLKKDIEAARTPAERYAVEQDRLTRALESGAISEGVYNRLLEEKRSKLLGVVEETQNYEGAITKVGTALVAYFAFDRVKDFFVSISTHLVDTIQQIDDTVDAADKLGLTFNEMTGLRFAGDILGGTDAGNVDAAVKKMMVNIAGAIDGDQTALKAFNKLGLNAAELLAAGPVKAIAMIADKYQGINTQAEKLNIAQDIFGKNGTEIVQMLDAGASAIEEQVAFINKANGLTEAQAASAGAAMDAWNNIGHYVDGVSTKLAIEIAPAAIVLADNVAKAAGGFEQIDAVMVGVVDAVVKSAGYMLEIVDVLNAMSLVNIDGSLKSTQEIAKGLRDAADVGRADEMLGQLEAKRIQFQTDAAKKAQKRFEDEQALKIANEDKLALHQKNLAADNLADELNRRFDAANQLQQMQRQEAIEALQDEIKEREKMERQKGSGSSTAKSYELGSSQAASFLQQAKGDQQKIVDGQNQQIDLLKKQLEELKQIKEKPPVQRKR